MRCLNCSYENQPQAKFCQNCGHALMRACPNCGTRSQPGARFCMNCGYPLAEGTQNGPAPPNRQDGQSDPRLVQLASTTPPPLAEKIRAAARLSGERRLVTTLFADVVGSTALAEGMDPEDWAGIMNRAFELVTPTIYHYEGTIARLMGDALLAFFGAPVAHEDDPERAARAALDLLASVRTYAEEVRAQYGIDFAMRVGLSTGPVVVGNVGSDLVYEYTAMGDAVNLAARLQSAARSMSILIAESTYRFVSTVFDFNPVGEIRVKGKSEPVRAYEVLAIKENPVRQRGLSNLFSPLVGRKAELKQLLQLSRAAQAGLGRVALVVGEAGVGKSRLVEEWKVALSGSDSQANQSLRWAEGHCLSYGQNLPYHLLADLVRNLLGAPDGASDDELWAALRERCADWFDAEADEQLPFFAHLLGLPLADPERSRLQGLDPQDLQVRYRTAFQNLLVAQSSRQPLAMVLEDLHWADPSSVDLLMKLLSLIKEAPLIFCVLVRPEKSAPGWRLVTSARSLLGESMVEIELHNLSEAESADLVTNLLKLAALPAGLRSLILKKAEGNPFFVEEMIRMCIDRGYIVQREGRWVVLEDQDISDLPDSLQGLLLARIDRLSEGTRATLRVAAVIGRRFSVRVLEQVTQKQRAVLDQHLHNLEDIGLIMLDRTEPELEFIFRHALLQEAASSSLLKHEQKELHRQVGEALEGLYADRLESIAVMLAQHFKLGEDDPRALKYFTTAAESAARQYALSEALDLYNQAITLAKKTGAPVAALLCARGNVYEIAGEIDLSLADLDAALQSTRQSGSRAEEWQVLINLGMVWASRNYEKAHDYFEQSLELARANEDARQIAHSLNRVGNWHMNNDQPFAAQRYHREALMLFSKLNDKPGLAETLDLLGISSGLSGETNNSDVYYQKAVALMREINDVRGLVSALATQTFQSPMLETDVVIGTGQPMTETIKNAEEALRLARQISFRSGEAYALFVKSQCLELMGQYGQAEEEARLGNEIATEINHDQWALASAIVLGTVYYSLFEIEPAVEYLEHAFELSQSTRSLNFLRVAAGWLARVYLLMSRLPDAARVLDTALGERPPALSLGQRVAWTARGELALASGQPEQALLISDLLDRDLRYCPPDRVPVRTAMLRGEALACLNRSDEALQVMRQAQHEAQMTGMKTLLWRCDAWLSRFYRVTGQPEQAEQQVASAVGLVTEMAFTLSEEDRRARYRQKALREILRA